MCPVLRTLSPTSRSECAVCISTGLCHKQEQSRLHLTCMCKISSRISIFQAVDCRPATESQSHHHDPQLLVVSMLDFCLFLLPLCHLSPGRELPVYLLATCCRFSLSQLQSQLIFSLLFYYRGELTSTCFQLPLAHT